MVITSLIYQVAVVMRQQRDLSSSSQAATCPPIYHTRWKFHTVPFKAERQEICKRQILLCLMWPDRESKPSLPFQKQTLYPFEHFNRVFKSFELQYLAFIFRHQQKL